MIVAHGSADLRQAIADARRDGRNGRNGLAFVPTMGFLHEGHLSLVGSAVATGSLTVASVFVNPRQFRPGEDFDSYPRDAARDEELLRAAGAHILFLPGEEDVYPPGFATEVKADPELAGCLCGASRGPQHFDGVVTVLSRLFALVSPDSAWFGEKDWQQLMVVRRLAADLFPDLTIIGGPTVRAADGLALSSRNSRLDPVERIAASAIPSAIASLQLAARPLADGSSLAGPISDAVRTLSAAGLEPEYIETRDAATLRPVESLDRTVATRIFVAASVGGTRLIDNAPLTPHGLPDERPAGADTPGTETVPAATST